MSKRGRPKEQHSELIHVRMKADIWLKLNDYALAHGIKHLSTAARQILIEFLYPENTKHLHTPTD